MGDYEQQQQQQPAKHAPTWTPVDRRVAGKLDVSDFRRVADARRELWTGGFIGMLGGLAAGYLGFHVYQRALAPAWLQSKHMVVFTLCGAAAGGYVGSAMRGMASFEGLGDGALIAIADVNSRQGMLRVHLSRKCPLVASKSFNHD